MDSQGRTVSLWEREGKKGGGYRKGAGRRRGSGADERSDGGGQGVGGDIYKLAGRGSRDWERARTLDLKAVFSGPLGSVRLGLRPCSAKRTGRAARTPLATFVVSVR